MWTEGGTAQPPAPLSATPALAPEWWHFDLAAQVSSVAQNALPNEACGLFCLYRSGVQLEPLSCVASASQFAVDPQVVIDFAYRVTALSGKAVATFHSHPLGQVRFSSRDQILGGWSNVHLILALNAQQWSSHWFQTHLLATDSSS